MSRGLGSIRLEAHCFGTFSFLRPQHLRVQRAEVPPNGRGWRWLLRLIIMSLVPFLRPGFPGPTSRSYEALLATCRSSPSNCWNPDEDAKQPTTWLRPQISSGNAAASPALRLPRSPTLVTTVTIVTHVEKHSYTRHACFSFFMANVFKCL